MEPNFKSAYEQAVKQADEMLGGMNIIANAQLKQRLSQSALSVKEQIQSAEKVASRTAPKAEYEAEMSGRLAALEQAINLVTVAVKKKALLDHYAQLQSSVNKMNALLGSIQRVQQKLNRYPRRSFR